MKTLLESKIPIILASASPRRIELMEQVCLKVDVRKPEIDENSKKGESPSKLVARLAREKAETARDLVQKKYKKAFVIAADTIVVAPGGKRVLGKPKNARDAKRMLRLLAGKSHTVLTGYCILLALRNGTSQECVRVVKSKVKMRFLDGKTIERYIATGEPMDKAGSYGAQGLGMALVERIEGSYSNVVGLPMAQILLDLERVFKVNLFSWLK